MYTAELDADMLQNYAVVKYGDSKTAVQNYMEKYQRIMYDKSTNSGLSGSNN